MMSIFSWLNHWQKIRANARKVLVMNQRNLHYVYPNNRRHDFPIADNKLLAKEVLVPAGVPMPKTYRMYSYFYELRNLKQDLSAYREFVIKPAQGSGGGGIIVITDYAEGHWISVSGKRYTLEDLTKRISDILFGIYSFGLSDTAIIEERLIQHPEMDVLSPYGLADIRVIMYRHHPVLSMTRLPTRASDGKANLHQGAVGVGIDITSGLTRHAIHKGQPAAVHPDTGVALINRVIPHWTEALSISRRAAEAVPLKYLGIDIAITTTGPKVLEINVRPGIEIQNANHQGLREILDPIRIQEIGYD